MLKILIVEDEPLLAATVKHLIELNPCRQVTGIAEDLTAALRSVDERRPDLALVDLKLARGSTGYSVAVKLGEIGIPCLFTTGNVPSFAMPELALGCLSKPFDEEDLVQALKAVEDKLRGRERLQLRATLPDTLQFYEEPPPVPVRGSLAASFLPQRSRTRARRAWWAA
jgi:two-component system, response regulator PdtaR